MIAQKLSSITPATFWHLLPHEIKMLQKKRGASRLVYVLLLKYFEKNYCFPENIISLPPELINYGITQTDEPITVENITKFYNKKRSVNRYKKEIRKYFGYKSFDKDCSLLKNFLLDIVFKEKNKATLKDAICKYLKKARTELPDEQTLLEIISKAASKKEQQFFSQIYNQLSTSNKKYIDDYLLASNAFGGVCQFLRQDSSSSTKANVKDEISRLKILRALPLGSLQLIDSISANRHNYYRRKFLTDTPKRSKRRLDHSRYALAAIFCHQRHQKALDNLVEHLLHFINQIKKIEHRKREKLDKEIGRRAGDLNQLYEIAEINRDRPKDIIEQAVYPTVPQESIDQMIKTRGFIRQSKTIIRETVIKRYSMSYRSTIFRILDHLDIHSHNTQFLEAINLIKKYRGSKLLHYPIDANVPVEGIISKQKQKDIFNDSDSSIIRKEYECNILRLLRVKLRHKEVWVTHAYKYRDPADDMPKDFEDSREEYYKLLGMPLSSKEFIDEIKQEMRHHLTAFDKGLPKNKYVSLTTKKDKPWITLTPLKKVEEPKIIQRIKESVLEKWGTIDLLDILKEVDLREDFTNLFQTAGNREILDRDTIRKRLLLCIFAFGTNTGLKRTAGASRRVFTFEALRHARRFFLNKEDLREAVTKVVNAIFKIRDPNIWKSVSTACAADSTQFGCFNKNLMTEWSPRHHNDGVMIYWHVSDQYICVYSQLKTCTSSEVASMLQGIIDQDTNMNITSQYVDSHGKSELGFALSYLQKFDLLPRYKTIGNQKLHLPEEDFSVTNIAAITASPICWERVEKQYNELIKHAVALNIGTSTADTIIRKFARSNYQHPTFKAFIELGKAIKTIFLCRYLHSLELRRQINAGLNVVENWNGANDFVFYGKSGEITSNYRDDQETSMLCLHLLQMCIVYINTILVEAILQDSYWQEQMMEADLRALTALFYLHINPYGTFELDFTKRLIINVIPKRGNL